MQSVERELERKFLGMTCVFKVDMVGEPGREEDHGAATRGGPGGTAVRFDGRSAGPGPDE